jgi:FkbM family methyltransferase
METIINDLQGSGIFIQIGAGAGDLDKRANYRDGFTEFIKSLPRNRIKKIILVEPNPLNIPLLRECWKDYKEAIIYEVAILPKNILKNTMELYYCPDDGPHYQVASIIKEHVYKHYGTNCRLEKFIINCIDLESFINNITNDEIELLALDIEGIDGEVILDLDLNNIKVKYLSYEWLHLGDDTEKVSNKLEKHNYKHLGKGVDHSGYDYLCVKTT